MFINLIINGEKRIQVKIITGNCSQTIDKVIKFYMNK